MRALGRKPLQMTTTTSSLLPTIGRPALLLMALSLALPHSGNAQAPFFSIDFQGPTAFSGVQNPDDVLFYVPGVGLNVFATTFGLAPSPTTGKIEIDAMSSECSKSMSGTNACQTVAQPEVFIDFSVDEFAAGIATSPSAPNVTSEGALGWKEASADVFNLLTLTMPPAPSPVFGNTAVFDGDGLVPWGGPGLGLVERNPPRVGIPDRGDNLDAMFYPNPSSTWIFFSLDAAWVDPLEGGPVNSGSAAANGFAPGDILVYKAGMLPPVTVYAFYWQLGLGPLDDVDALLIHETGDGVFKPSWGPYEWDTLPCHDQDMLLFSVRRGSPIIGTLDTIRGLPIEEGDILTVMNGGTSAPGIFVPAEALGLRTVRGGHTLPFGYADDLDAMEGTGSPASCPTYPAP